MIEIDNISKYYGSISALSGVSFKIDKGTVFGLLGPNGAGKTTTLDIISGVLRPDTGRVVVDGLSTTTDLPEIQSHIGYLSEDNPLYDDLMVYEMLEFARRLKRVDQSTFNSNKDRIIQETGISAIYYRPIETLSKGLRQRVGIAVSMIGDPDILILDEPTEGLDPNQRQDIRALITRLGKDHTVIVSTHVMQEVEAMCNSVLILDNGKVVLEGNVESLLGDETGNMQVWLSVSGSGSIINSLEQKYNVSHRDNHFVVMVDKENEQQLYKDIAIASSAQSYVTNMHKKSNKLEEVFQKVTKQK
ncbi:ABC transporter ATP-binding protein [bacterium]|uniref:ABC transporter domain-containing protein n=2 Tax=Katanobacteria TaxID=422282 RepID=A0A2M7X208_UNCKA|nr:ABC transporter ATP-binding protein [bacterium]PIP56330.1 MAG: hypothetical protein COX05_03620 [candidate division WWE3 bacterium CG22_combo_CG10-13_8_21_14_all_39_12]PJA40202.1 MAG: hypothetical protein CO179_03010 [candidate division WWE3 bacterium CG_4_9_14_3_um_filter_39_7]